MNYSNYAGEKDIFVKSKTSITFIDSCGKKQYLDTTLSGLTTFDPQTILILINPKRISKHINL